MPRFTVVMPVFNGAAFLTDAIKSVAAQDRHDLEMIVVDDGSSDSSVELAEKTLFESRLVGRVFRRPPSVPKGAGACRNYGASKARSEIIAFIDADDIWVPRHLDNGLAALNEHPSAGVYCAMAKTFVGDMDVIGQAPHDGFPCIGACDAMPILLKGMIVPVQTLCVRREVFARTKGFAEHLECYEDWWLVLQLARLTPFVFSPTFDCMVRVRASSASRQTLGNDRLVMSSGMYRDQFALYDGFRQGQLLSSGELSKLRASVTEWNVRQISDQLCAANMSEGFRMIRALGSAGFRTSDLAFSVGARVAADVVSRGARKAVRVLRRKARSS